MDEAETIHEERQRQHRQRQQHFNSVIQRKIKERFHQGTNASHEIAVNRGTESEDSDGSKAQTVGQIIAQYQKDYLTVVKLLNTFVGRFTLPEMLTLSPIEIDYMVAGGQQRQLNWLNDVYLIRKAPIPVGFIEKDEVTEQVNKALTERQVTINQLTDRKAKQVQRKQERERSAFMDMFFKYDKQGR